MTNDLEVRLGQLNLSEEQKRFFIGWCDEGGEEFRVILGKLLSLMYEKGFHDGYC